MTNSSLVVGVACGDQGDGDEVMTEHLPMILPSLLDVNNKDLLEPECQLRQQIALHKATELSVGPVGPELLHIQVIGRNTVEVLLTNECQFNQ
jgi:hypothetical protein